MQVSCPNCGARDVIEFTWGDEADLSRPPDPGICTDTQWSAYLFIRKNPRGMQYERWCHTYGCGQWFNVHRHTVTHRAESVDETDPPRTGIEEPV